MQRVIERLHLGLGYVERAFALLAGVVVLLMMVVVCAEVFGRSAFNQPIRGVIDIVSQLMALIAAGGVAYSQSRFGNVRMTIFSGRLTGRTKWLSEILTLAISTWVVFILMRGSSSFLQRAWRSGADTPEIFIPTWIGISLVTAALGLLFARLVLQLVEALRLFTRPKSGSQVFNVASASIATTLEKG